MTMVILCSDHACATSSSRPPSSTAANRSTVLSKCPLSLSATPSYSSAPCLCSTKLYALRYNSSK
eukprot:CAMPEP_0197451902 /NCGR_PEP_ID=MMETSP1175-20131217/30495_1 /TAXON_ID=1003142 /ORGANISM="Triceratium dubium, Strain CCMP147" /LENGTH=64 /DNA_ID=CAMNT_0042984771 /DNA_START=41 /DNA_END=232 /DNA_ORIENTATION=-